jgi:hypothetical protein
VKHRSDIRPGKRQFGIYKYLTDIYQVFLELRSRQQARTATRRIAKICKLLIKKKSHPLRILIEASAGPEDPRQKGRWTQALKYADGWHQPAAVELQDPPENMPSTEKQPDRKMVVATIIYSTDNAA